MTRDAKAKGASPVLLFLGEPSVVDPEIRTLVDGRVAAASQSLDFEIFRHGERPLGEIEAALRQVGMFSPQRCIWLRSYVEPKRRAGSDDAEGVEEDDGEQQDDGSAGDLLRLLETGIPTGSTLLISAASLDARGKLFKWLSKNAELRDRRVQLDQKGKLSETGLRGAIQDRLAELGVLRVAPGVVDEIQRRSGTVLGETLQEVDRLVLAQSDPTRLDAEAVRAAMRDLSLGYVFDLTAAIERRDLAAAERLVERLLDEGEPPLRMTALLASHLGNLVAARPVVESLPKGALRLDGKAFLAGPGAGLPDAWRGWRGYFRLRAAANFRSEELQRLHGELLRLDAALKGSPASPLLLFSRLLQSVCIPGAALDAGRS